MLGVILTTFLRGYLRLIDPLLNLKTDKEKMEILGTVYKFSPCKGLLTVMFLKTCYFIGNKEMKACILENN